MSKVKIRHYRIKRARGVDAGIKHGRVKSRLLQWQPQITCHP